MSYNPRQFVDREPELAAFHDCLQDRNKSRVLLFYGLEGMGKTAMLNHLRAACREAQTACAFIDFQHDGLNIPMEFIYHLRQQIGGAEFDALGKELVALQQEFPEQISQLHGLPAWPGSSLLPAVQPSPAVSIEAQIGNVGDENMIMVGTQNVMNKITINNAQIFNAPEKVTGLIQKERLYRMNQALRGALERLVSRKQLVLLFDACDSATPDLVGWLREQLLDPLLESGQPLLANLVLVLVGDPHCERGTWLDEFIQWGEGVTAMQLSNLPGDAVKKYWIDIRHLSEKEIPLGFSDEGAPPFLMVNMANYYAELNK